MPTYFPEGDAPNAEDCSTRMLHKIVSLSGAGGSVTNTYSGSGSPEGVQIGTPYDRYVDTDTGYEWRKDTGTGTNTGWVRVI